QSTLLGLRATTLTTVPSGSGNWSFTPGIPLPDGTVVNVVARSPSNVDSAPAVITVDGVAPAAPVIDPSNG
ncbi:hypothetical protein, partial [Pseudomonas aeruginosa]